MIVGPRPEKNHMAFSMGVAIRKPCQIASELQLGKRRGNVQRPAESDGLRDFPQEILKCRDANGVEHRLLILWCIRNVLHPVLPDPESGFKSYFDDFFP